MFFIYIHLYTADHIEQVTAIYRIKIYSKMHRESTKMTAMSRWPLYKGERYDRFDCIWYNYVPIV